MPLKQSAPRRTAPLICHWQGKWSETCTGESAKNSSVISSWTPIWPPLQYEICIPLNKRLKELLSYLIVNSHLFTSAIWNMYSKEYTTERTPLFSHRELPSVRLFYMYSKDYANEITRFLLSSLYYSTKSQTHLEKNISRSKNRNTNLLFPILLVLMSNRMNKDDKKAS